ncbi:MAG: hypothetical protein OEW11_10905 [Nitrospirota bacterium]|nr:hypothetical protein [Nitrospirota bacterium]
MNVQGKNRSGVGNRMLPGLLLATVLLSSWGCAHGVKEASVHRPDAQVPAEYAAQMAHVRGAEKLSENLGIELLALRQTAAGHMLDLRYTVVDPAAATRLLGEHSRLEVFLVDKATGQTAEIPTTMLGQLRTKTAGLRTSRIYYVLFRNPGQVVHTGSQVEIHFGDVVVDNVPVL